VDVGGYGRKIQAKMAGKGRKEPWWRESMNRMTLNILILKLSLL
jgi:hypothetical protein